jgi:transcriptional regulator with XRE-family HTH domain
MRGVIGVDAHVGVRLRALREKRQLTQQELGRRADVRYQQIQKYEGGKNRIAASRLFQLARILEVPVSAFFENMPGFEGETRHAVRVTADLEAFATSREGVELLTSYVRIPIGPRRREVLRLIRVLGGTD